MAYADDSTYFAPTGDGSILGSFREKDCDNHFEFSENREGVYTEYPHKVWVTTPWHMDAGWRFATVKKTVAYVLVNDDVVEKWYIKNYRGYVNSST